MYRTTTLVCALLCTQLSAQLTFTFDNNDLSHWNGDVHDFIVNENGQLQLNAREAGQSSIYTDLIFPDSIVWQLDVSLDFSPSGSNKLTVWLGIDTTNISSANGYYLEIGEPGGEDAIHFFQLENGTPVLLASGIMGGVADPVNVMINLEKNSNDWWTLSTTDLDSNNSIQEFVLYFPDENISNQKYFGISCYYTRSRSEAFAFDNVSISEIVADTIPPDIIAVEILDPLNVCISYSEKITESSAENINNYKFMPAIEIKHAVLDSADHRKVILVLKSDLPGGQIIRLATENIEDLFSNKSLELIYEIELIELAEPGDILINEILFDPFTGGEDFIELINHSEKNINLAGWILYNADKDESQDIMQEYILRPHEILAFSKNPDYLYKEYRAPEDARIVFQDIPSLNNSDGNVSIIQIDKQTRSTIDSFDYSADYHHELLNDTEGISLERISLSGLTNDPNNWFSASQLHHFATPGYQNSTRIESPGKVQEITLYDKVFSPDQDGVKDHLIIQYALEKPGYIANISIHDDRGRLEKKLVRNASLSTEGLIKWDGLNDNGQLLPVGIYIILFEIYHSDGDIISAKKACVLAQNLD